MIVWRDDALLLDARPFGETSVIAHVLTPEHGHVAGVVRGGVSRKMAPHLQPGAQLGVAWQARLQEHLGTFTIEPQRGRMAAVLGDRLALAGLNAVCALLPVVLPEGEPHPPLYLRTVQLMDLLGQGDVWPLAYLHWELALLDELGFGLDLTRCAVTGRTDDLAYVSPKSGRAVSRDAAGEWASRMLPLPPVMTGQGNADEVDIVAALGTTGWFIAHRLIRSLGDRSMPEARARLIETIARQGRG